MAKARLGMRPLPMPWFPHEEGLNNIANIQPTTVIDAADEEIQMIGSVMWEDGATHDLSTVHFRCHTAGTPNYTLRVSLRDVDLVNGPPGRDDTTPDQTWTQANPSAGTSYAASLSAARTVAHGEQIAVTFDFSAWTAGTFAPTIFQGAAFNRQPLNVHILHFDGTSTYTGQGATPALTFEASDGTYGMFLASYPAVSAGLTQLSYNADNATQDETALEFTVAAPIWIGSLGFWLTPSTGDFSLVLYEDGTQLVSVTVDPNTLHSANPRRIEVPIADTALVTGRTYRLSLKPLSTTAGVTMYYMTVGNAGFLDPFADNMAFTSRVDGGSWAAPTTTRLPFAFVGVVAVDDGAGGGFPQRAEFIHGGGRW